ncbi:MAG: DUF2782 domain-containing protein [Betaproteobacteria bacterium]|nr:DUF2782 domain-containing protein [Betaproteobacteria bacterium]
MRSFIAILLLAVALPLAAQTQGRPSNLQPVPEPPPPPKGYEPDPALEPQVTILKRGADTVEEFRIGGKLYMIKVTPASGGTFTRQDNFNSGIRPPMWVIFQF